MDLFDPSEIRSSLGADTSKPIVQAFTNASQLLKAQQDVLDHQQNMLNVQNTEIQKLNERFEEYKNGALDRKAEIKKDLLLEIATKADIEKMNGKIDSLEQKMNGKIDSLEQKMNGEFKIIKLWMKMLMALALLTIACFSPTAQTLIKWIKF